MLEECCTLKGKSNVFVDLRRSHLAISPCLSYICVGKGKEIFLWTSEGEIMKLPCIHQERITFLEMISISGMGKVIKKILCLVIGYESGEIAFVALPSGTVLLRQKMHDKPVMQIKARTMASIPLVGTAEEQDEELSVLFEDSTLIIIEGDSLITEIRSQFLRNKDIKYSQDPSGLQFRKYMLKHTSSGRILDFITTGYSGIRETNFGSMIIGVGKNPMISVYLGYRDSGSLITIASNVASKLTSSIVSFAKSWWGAPEPNPESVEPPLPKASKISRITQLEDPMRKIHCIVGDGTSRLGAFGDALGRVCLLDFTYSPPLVIRMWKGYRDVQLAFFQSSSPVTASRFNKRSKTNKKSMQRKILFSQYLVIYAPRRGLLEIWKVRNGSRQAVFNVGEDCILINDSQSFGKDPGRPGKQECFLLHKSTGKLTKITIDPSLHGTSELSQRKLSTFIQLVDKLDTNIETLSTEEVSSIQEELITMIHDMDGPEQFSVMTQRVLAISFTKIENPKVFPISFLLQFMENITSILAEKTNSKSHPNSPASSSPQSIQQLIQLQRIERIISSINILHRLYDLFYGEENVVTACKNVWQDFVGLECPCEGEEKQEHHVIVSRASLMFLQCFDLATGRIKPNEIHEQENLLFAWFLFPEKQSSTEMIISVFKNISVASFELQNIFADWYFTLSLDTLTRLPTWKHPNTNELTWSLQLFIERILLQQLDAEIEMDPLDLLFHRCAESTCLYHVLLLIKFILECYHQENFYKQCTQHVAYTKRWTQLKSKVELLIRFASILPREILHESPLSVVLFETTNSLAYYKAFLLVAEQRSECFNLSEDFDVSGALHEISELFPKHVEHSQMNLFVQLHEIMILVTLWAKEKDDDSSRGIIMLESAVDKIQALKEHNELKKGIILKIWKEFLSQKASTLVSVIEKVRKVPKQRMLLRATNMTVTAAPVFLQCMKRMIVELQHLSNSGKEETHIIYRPVGEDTELWPPLSDSIYYQLHRVACDTVCSPESLEEHEIIVDILQAIFKYDLQQVQPLQLFPSTSALFSSFVHPHSPSEENEEDFNLRYGMQAKFLAIVAGVDFDFAMELANRMKVQESDVLVRAVEHYYSQGSLLGGEMMMKYSGDDYAVFFDVLENLCKLQCRMILIDQPYARKHLPTDTIRWIDENYEERPCVECKVADISTIEQFQQQAILIGDIVKHLRIASACTKVDISEQLNNILAVCDTMSQSTFAEWFAPTN